MTGAEVPDGVDVTVASSSRVCDYALGGVHNFAVDRAFWHRLLKAYPPAEVQAYANRAFLCRAVRWLVASGVDQILDIGCGIPDRGAVHEIAQAHNPHARIVYADLDPITVEQARKMLIDNRHALAIRGDLRTPEKILYDPRVLNFLDFSEQVAVVTTGVWHFIPDSADPTSLVRRIADALATGSHLVLTHACPAPTPSERAQQEAARRLYDQTATPAVLRGGTQIAELLDDQFELLDPGLVAADVWLPDPDDPDPPRSPALLAAIARRRPDHAAGTS